MSIYQHFRPEEREFIDQVMNWKDHVENTYTSKLTDFLDPREQHILKTLVGEGSSVKWALFGGSQQAERKRAFLYPEYDHAKPEDYQISLFEVVYPSKFLTIEHPQVLGSLMSVGLKRGKFGDILFDNGCIQFFAASEIKDYLIMQLESIGRASVTLREVSMVYAIVVDEAWQEIDTTVSSLRLDTVIASFHNVSRQKSQLYIQQGHVKVNWTMVENASFECKEGDMISVRGFGRTKIMSIDGKTKKEKWRISVGKYK